MGQTQKEKRKKKSREYGAGHKRCQIFISPGTPVQRRGCYSPWGPWGKPQPPNGGGVVQAQAGHRDSVKPDDEAGVKQAVNRRYPKWADGRSRDPQAEAWCQAKRDDEEASYTASQRESKHAAHQGGGTRSTQGLTALFGSDRA